MTEACYYYKKRVVTPAYIGDRAIHVAVLAGDPPLMKEAMHLILENAASMYSFLFVLMMVACQVYGEENVYAQSNALLVAMFTLMCRFFIIHGWWSKILETITLRIHSGLYHHEVKIPFLKRCAQRSKIILCPSELTSGNQSAVSERIKMWRAQ